MTLPTPTPTSRPLLSSPSHLLARRRCIAYHLPDLAHAARCAPLVLCALVASLLGAEEFAAHQASVAQATEGATEGTSAQAFAPGCCSAAR